MDLEEWLQKATAQAQFHSTGKFALDTAAAARKFGNYALREPLQIVARMLRAAVLCGAPAQVWLEKRKTVVHLFGLVSGVSQLHQVFDQVLSPTPEEREFSIAVNSLVARPFSRLTITRGEPSRIARLEMGSDRQVETAVAYDLVQTEAFTHTVWTQPDSRSVSADRDRLQHWFRHCPTRVVVNGQPLGVRFGKPRGPGLLKHLGADKQVLLKGPWYQPASYFWADHHALEFRLYHPRAERNELWLPTPGEASSTLVCGADGGHPDRCFLALACPCEGQGPGRVDWVYRGQALGNSAENWPLGALVAVVACEGLPFDLTGDRPQEGPALAARLQMVRDWANVLHDFLSDRYKDDSAEVARQALWDRKLRHGLVQLPKTRRVEELLGRLRG